MGRQAHGAVLATYGQTAVLVTAVANLESRAGIDFFPLTVNFQTKTYAAGKIPGGFFKREGRPPDSDTLTSRLIDRPLRPLFPKGFTCETQIIATVLSHDTDNPPDTVAMVGASAALSISDIPFEGPIGCVRIGHVDGQYIINPTLSELESSRLNLIIAGTADAVTMVESGSKMLTEDEMLRAIELGHEEIRRLVALQKDLVGLAGKPKRAVPQVEQGRTLGRGARCQGPPGRVAQRGRLAPGEGILNRLREHGKEARAPDDPRRKRAYGRPGA
jgi:polyribonucleotide nucleotidyltransferase